MQRVRYKKLSVNIYQSTKPILLGQNLAKVDINLESRTLKIFDGSHILYETSGKDYTELKKKAKNALKELGASFQDEIRKKI